MEVLNECKTDDDALAVKTAEGRIHGTTSLHPTHRQLVEIEQTLLPIWNRTVSGTKWEMRPSKEENNPEKASRYKQQREVIVCFNRMVEEVYGVIHIRKMDLTLTAAPTMAAAVDT